MQLLLHAAASVLLPVAAVPNLPFAQPVHCATAVAARLVPYLPFAHLLSHASASELLPVALMEEAYLPLGHAVPTHAFASEV